MAGEQRRLPRSLGWLVDRLERDLSIRYISRCVIAFLPSLWSLQIDSASRTGRRVVRCRDAVHVESFAVGAVLALEVVGGRS
ncbi:hypothetical protein D8S78_02535 [Natrialba swarupiae]|nr:hypothetical protein [Natrialba swarupiae]